MVIIHAAFWRSSGTDQGGNFLNIIRQNCGCVCGESLYMYTKNNVILCYL